VDKPEEKNIKSGESLRAAVTIIIFADLIMSLDNVLAIAAIADSNMLLIIAGVILSIPIILYASEVILKGIQKYPIIIYIGAALLAWTAGNMMLKENLFHTSKVAELLFLNGITLTILLLGGLRRKSIPK
jgi:predicted tellurium resistance membrane protein TerC